MNATELSLLRRERPIDRAVWLRTQVAVLEAENERLRTQAATLTHDARNLLLNLAGFTHLLAQREGDRLDEVAQEYLAHVTRAVGSLQELLGQLEGRRGVIRRPEVIALDDVVDDVLAGVAPQVADTGARVEVGPLPKVRGERHQLRRLFANLIVNSLVHTRPGQPPVVSVDAELTEAGWEVAVTDNGPGVPREDRERIFGLFERASGDGAGTGLGLAICRQVVEAHGGQIRVEDGPGGGSRFVVLLPGA